jgi:hypothetical protein
MSVLLLLCAGALVWAAVSEETPGAPADTLLFTYFANQVSLGMVADMPHALTKN